MKDLTDTLRKKLASDRVLLGTHVFCGDTGITECMAMAGYDIMWIDTEHTAIGGQRLLDCLIAVRAGGTPAMVRIPWNDPVLAKPVLDMGPDVLLFPNVRNEKEAREAVRACEYPPKGVRGFGPQRALEYGALSQADYVLRAYRRMLRFIQIEDIAAVENLESICSVDGIDGYIVGPNDLSASLGHLDDPLHPEMLPIYDRIGETLRRCGKIFGAAFGYNSEVVKAWRARGAKILFCGSDIGHVYEGSVRTLEWMRRDTK